MSIAAARYGPTRFLALLALLAALLVAPATAPALYLVPEGTSLPSGTRVLGHFPVAGALVVSGSTAPAGAVPADASLSWMILAPAGSDALRLDSGVASTRAPQAWDTTRGEQAVVALIDTGVGPVPALDGAVAGEIDFTGTGGGDGFGHGTFMASLIAGRPLDLGGQQVGAGVAPGAGVLSLKVALDDGSTDLITVLSALQWLHGPGRAAGIKVATIALGVDADDPAAELLDEATQALARAGILVVTAAGNEGPGSLTSPATSTGTFSVGAVDDQGTADRSDDVAATFSSTGFDRAGVAQPDVTASGVSVVGSLPADSVIAQSHPDSVVEEHFFRGSGTSMSTAIAAGVAALASSARPDLDGDALADALRAAGGELDAVTTLTAALDAPARPGAGNGPGSGNADPSGSRAPEHTPDRTTGNRGAATADPAAVRWTAVRWTAVRWTAVRWTAVRWTGSGWGNADWPVATWGAVRWTGTNWADAPLDGDAFNAVRWTSVRWTSVRWTSVRWTSVRWTSVRWTLVAHG